MNYNLYKRFNLIFLTLILILLTSCTPQNGTTKIKLYTNEVQNVSEPSKYGEDTLIIAIASVVSPKESLEKYQGLVAYLEEKLGQPVKVIQKQTYSEVNQLLKDGNADITLTCSLAYRIGSKEGYMEGLVAPVVKGESLYQSYIITNKNNPYDSLDDLKGKKFAFVDPISYSGRLSVLDMLNEKGYKADTFFEKTFYTYSHDYSLLAAANNVVDGAAIDSLLFDQLLLEQNPDVQNLKIIGKGELAGTPPIVMKDDLDPTLKAKLRDVILSLEEDRNGQKILKSLGIDKYADVNENNYKIIDDLIDQFGEQLYETTK
ncbi:substrate-binding domain-containing protein [Schinkia azotoformans]|uniref:substrate-binding domain-containing protein n=1 Tax=Schinkia azotoformans TaxID=1454 RepID=UPI002DBAE7E7|nr:phosphate/phosphite/phosphonate ABC transporter substrate-binding protein [Schinkia azotoformans]MEC1718932.1 phosphate/phosphite/phosphonate ABC transporter substrate-binding protein [Schinkia azotoformans]MED4412856.1 phosphate/phosphite/phosphonate ABC transporter substrate-binding protein [Schinkia azotoformans]